MEKGEKFLPIGTVVILKNGKKRVMISGFCVVDGDDNDKIWDYSGCLYPEGLIDISTICLFNHEQIQEVYHLGLVDDEEKKFKDGLKEVIDHHNSNRSL